uniref:EGF-like domain-containing protein n=1 Tax=Angiostrongylus cantonensis TaxID=6313 RepID=A0A0K0D1I6_ANGCA
MSTATVVDDLSFMIKAWELAYCRNFKLPLWIVQQAIIDTMSSNEGLQPRVDFIGPNWLPRTYKVTCCRGGEPIAENTKLIKNWTQKSSDYIADEHTPSGYNDHCRVFEGTFMVSATALFNFSFSGYGVQCKCPDTKDALDRHCRKLAPCKNNGYRSQSLGMLCVCIEPFFGEYCDKICNQGQVLKGVDGRSYCSCLPFYRGERCTEMVCLNGGVEVNGRCTCPRSYAGFHCEIDANRTTRHEPRYHRFEDVG